MDWHQDYSYKFRRGPASKGACFESVICLEMRYSDPTVVWGKERSHLCLCQINSPLASQRCIVQINELTIKATCLSPLKNRGTGRWKEWVLSSVSPSGCPSSWAGPCSGSRTSHAPTLGSCIRDQGVSHLQFSKVQKNKVPSNADGAVSLFPKTERKRGAGRERSTERPPLFKDHCFWRMGRWSSLSPQRRQADGLMGSHPFKCYMSMEPGNFKARRLLTLWASHILHTCQLTRHLFNCRAFDIKWSCVLSVAFKNFLKHFSDLYIT